MKRNALFALTLLLLLVSCTKKPTEVTTDSVWTGTMEVQGVPLANVLTIYSDKSFTLDTTVTVLGMGMNFNKVGLGKVQGDFKEEGEITLTLEEVAQDIIPILESAGMVEFPLPLTISASVQKDQLILSDVSLGQEIRLSRQEVQ